MGTYAHGYGYYGYNIIKCNYQLCKLNDIIILII